MNKVELVEKLYKPNQNSKKNAVSRKTSGKASDVKNDSVELSSTAVSLNKSKTPVRSSDVRHDLVNKYKDDIKKGTYEVKTNEIAEKIIQKYREEYITNPYA